MYHTFAGATALWALAGENIENQKRIAELIGINILVDMLMTKSERLQYVAGMALTALGKEDIASQNRISEGGGIMALVRILRGLHLVSSEKVRLSLLSHLMSYVCLVKLFSLSACFHEEMHLSCQT